MAELTENFRKVLLNVVMNLAGNVSGVLIGIVTVPHLVASFGVSTYGLWSLVAVTTGILAVLDLGVSGAVCRLLAMHRGREGASQANVVMSTGFVILSAVSVCVGLLALLSPRLFHGFFEVPAALAEDVKLALVLCGLNVAVRLLGSVFNGHFWAHERFDLLNLVGVPITMLRAIAILQFIGSGSTLSELAAIQLILTLVGVIVLVVVHRWIAPESRIDPRLFDRRIAWEIYGVGFWYFLVSSSRNVLPQVAAMVIGYRGGPVQVATYSVATQLAGYTGSIANDATQVLAPRAAALYGASRAEQQLALFMHGGRCALALSLYLVGGVVSLGLPFIQVWQHGRLDAAYAPLVILALGELVAMSQAITYSTIMAMGRMKVLALISALEGAAILGLSLALVGALGVIGVSIAVAVPAFLFRGVGRWLYGCRLLKVSPWRYLKDVGAAVLAAASVPLTAGVLIVDWLAPASWLGLLAAGLAYSAIFAAFVVPLLLLRGGAEAGLQLGFFTIGRKTG